MLIVTSRISKIAYFILFTAGNLFLVVNVTTDGQPGKNGERCEDD